VIDSLFGDMTTTPLEPFAIFTLFLVIVFTGVVAIIKALAMIEKWIVDVGGEVPDHGEPVRIRRSRYTLVGLITLLMMLSTIILLMLWQSSVQAKSLIEENTNFKEDLQENEELILVLNREREDLTNQNLALVSDLSATHTQLAELDVERAEFFKRMESARLSENVTIEMNEEYESLITEMRESMDDFYAEIKTLESELAEAKDMNNRLQEEAAKYKIEDDVILAPASNTSTSTSTSEK